MPILYQFFRPAYIKHAQRLCTLGGALVAASVLTACINPPVTSKQTQTAHAAPVSPAPNVPIVNANVPNQAVAHVPTTTPAIATPTAAVPATSAQGLALQAGTFSVRSNADAVATAIRTTLPQYAHLVQVQARNSNWRVLIGGFADEHTRMQAAQTIRNLTNYEVVNAAP